MFASWECLNVRTRSRKCSETVTASTPKNWTDSEFEVQNSESVPRSTYQIYLMTNHAVAALANASPEAINITARNPAM